MHSIRKMGGITALIVMVLVIFHQLAFTDLILARGDTFNFFYPYWDARSEAFRSGTLPLWSPELFMGSPLLAEPQVGTFYPPNWLMTPFNAPDAVRYSVLLHVLWAGMGMLWLFRRISGDTRTIPALVAALTFALGGYMTAHVEQINQLQGLAWLPWIAALWHRLLHPLAWRSRLRDGLLLAAALAMQFFSGHTQTVFITGVVLALMWLTYSVQTRRVAWVPFLLGAAIGMGVLLLVLPQFLPTLELTGMSNRGGSGFNADQATAFSLPPHYIGRSLLPGYDGLLFTEYLASIGVVGLGLAVVGGLYGHRGRGLAVVLVIIGLLLALGRFNPLYYEVLAHLPGFNLFRVPARWLALFALGAALLAGLGTLTVLDQPVLRRRWIPWMVLIVLMAVAVLPRFIPALGIAAEDISGGGLVTERSLLAWGVALAILALVLWRRNARLLAAAVALELAAASLIMPFNDLAPREVYTQARFTTHQMNAYAEESTVPPRLLAISGLLFDVGDRETLRARYEAFGLGEEAIQLAFTALKRQEILAGNLPLTWGVQSADGYGGGLLPTMYYSQYTSLLLPEGSLRTVDGRMGEMMARSECRGACLPSFSRLARSGITHLLTDKIHDVWHENVGYDAQQWPATRHWIAPAPFPTEEIRVLSVGNPQIQLSLGEAILEGTYRPIDDTLGITLYRLDSLRELEQARVLLDGSDDALGQVLAMSLVNTQMGTFLPMSPTQARRVLSSDIKLYELGGMRAYIATFAQVFEDSWAGSEAALKAMSQPMSPDTLHLPADAPQPMPAAAYTPVSIEEYSATRVVIRVPSYVVPNYLILLDAWYPGWQATINGEPVPVYRANVMYRAVYVPRGDSTIVFTFAPALWDTALKIGLVAWGVWLALLAVIVRTRPVGSDAV